MLFFRSKKLSLEYDLANVKIKMKISEINLSKQENEPLEGSSASEDGYCLMFHGRRILIRPIRENNLYLLLATQGYK